MVKVKPISMFTVERRQRIMIINTDLITRIPTDKSESAKKKKDSVYNFIRYIFNHVPIKVIFLTEKPLKEYKMQVTPTVIGRIFEFTNPYFIADALLHEPDREKVLGYLDKYGTYLDPLITILQYYFNKYEPEKEDLDDLIRMFFKMRFEDTQENVFRFMVNFFKASKKRNLSVGKLRYYGFKPNDLSIIRSV